MFKAIFCIILYLGSCLFLQSQITRLKPEPLPPMGNQTDLEFKVNISLDRLTQLSYMWIVMGVPNAKGQPLDFMGRHICMDVVIWAHYHVANKKMDQLRGAVLIDDLQRESFNLVFQNVELVDNLAIALAFWDSKQLVQYVDFTVIQLPRKLQIVPARIALQGDLECKLEIANATIRKVQMKIQGQKSSTEVQCEGDVYHLPLGAMLEVDYTDNVSELPGTIRDCVVSYDLIEQMQLLKTNQIIAFQRYINLKRDLESSEKKRQDQEKKIRELENRVRDLDKSLEMFRELLRIPEFCRTDMDVIHQGREKHPILYTCSQDVDNQMRIKSADFSGNPKLEACLEKNGISLKGLPGRPGKCSYRIALTDFTNREHVLIGEFLVNDPPSWKEKDLYAALQDSGLEYDAGNLFRMYAARSEMSIDLPSLCSLGDIESHPEFAISDNPIFVVTPERRLSSKPRAELERLPAQNYDFKLLVCEGKGNDRVEAAIDFSVRWIPTLPKLLKIQIDSAKLSGQTNPSKLHLGKHELVWKWNIITKKNIANDEALSMSFSVLLGDKAVEKREISIRAEQQQGTETSDIELAAEGKSIPLRIELSWKQGTLEIAQAPELFNTRIDIEKISYPPCYKPHPTQENWFIREQDNMPVVRKGDRYVDCHEVTVGQYKAFVASSDYPRYINKAVAEIWGKEGTRLDFSHSKGRMALDEYQTDILKLVSNIVKNKTLCYDAGKDRYLPARYMYGPTEVEVPVVGVSVFEAYAYTLWISKELQGFQAGLPVSQDIADMESRATDKPVKIDEKNFGRYALEEWVFDHNTVRRSSSPETSTNISRSDRLGFRCVIAVRNK